MQKNEEREKTNNKKN